MSALVSLELHHRISQFLYEEARMLDDWQFRDYLDFQRQQRPTRTSYRAAGNRHGLGGRAAVAYPSSD